MKTFHHAGGASRLAAALFLCTLSGTALAAKMPDKDCAPGMVPTFTDYAVQAQTGLKRPRLKLNNAFSRRFKTRLRDGLRDNPVDFAGHYVMVTIGCGNGCLYGGYIDAATGQATELPFSVNPAGLFREQEPIARKAGSRLLIVTGNLNGAEGPEMRYFFGLEDGKLKPICHAPLQTDTPSGNRE